MEVRIGSGKWRGRRLATPGGATHPMGAREKLALFNMLSERLAGAVVLDAYAGSGALGLEALSRGAARVVFLERASRAAKVIRENLRTVGAEENAAETEAMTKDGTTKVKTSRSTTEVVACDTGKFDTPERFDIILADPPYDDFHIAEVAHLTGFVKDGGVLVLSHPGEAPVLQGLTLDKTRKYAGASLSFYIK